MKKVVRLTETQLNNAIKKVIKEQESAQVMTTGPSPEQIAGSPETDAEGAGDDAPNFEQFLTCAKELLEKGVTIGNLVDQLLDADKEGTEPEGEENAEPTPEEEPETPIA